MALHLSQLWPPCPICTATQLAKPKSFTAKDYISDETFHIHQCHHCHTWQTRMPSGTKSADYYGTEYYNSRSGKFSPILEKIFILNHFLNAKQLAKHCPKGKVLEVGCGRGYLLRALKEMHAAVFCLEAPDAAEWILKNPEVPVSTIDENSDTGLWPFEDNFFDLVMFWHVLEHLPDPRESLRQASKKLKADGLLCISFPNNLSLQARINHPTWFHLDVPRHLFHFSLPGLTQLLELEGFTIVKTCSGDKMQNLFGWLQSAANLFTRRHINSIYRVMQGGFIFRRVNKWALLTQVLTFPFWFTIGLCGFLIEQISGNHGTLTVYAKKNKPLTSIDTPTGKRP